MLELSLLFMAAGKSSRFGGQPKLLAKVGKNNESLFELSIIQIKKHIQIKHIHLISNEENAIEILSEAKNIRYKYDLDDIDITSNIQTIPRFRNKPWGTADAAASAWSYMKGPFLLLNSDDLYDEITFETIAKNCDKSKNYIIGYELGKTLKNDKKANRGFIDIFNNKIFKLTEKLNIEKRYYSEEELKDILVSVNLFLFQPTILQSLFVLTEKFKEDNDMDNEIETLLPDFLNKLLANKTLELELMKSEGEWNGITFKSDIVQIKKEINT